MHATYKPTHMYSYMKHIWIIYSDTYMTYMKLEHFIYVVIYESYMTHICYLYVAMYVNIYEFHMTLVCRNIYVLYVTCMLHISQLIFIHTWNIIWIIYSDIYGLYMTYMKWGHFIYVVIYDTYMPFICSHVCQNIWILYDTCMSRYMCHCDTHATRQLICIHIWNIC